MYIPKILQNAIFGLSLFGLVTLKMVHNRVCYYSLFLKSPDQKSNRPKHSIFRHLGYNPEKVDVTLFVLSIFIALSSVVMFSLNHYYFRFPGLFYFEPTFLAYAIFLLMVRFGLILQFDLACNNTLIKMLKEATIYSLIIVLILFGTSAVQYTPFRPIDKKIIEIEQFLNLDLQSAIAWFGMHRTIKTVANVVYQSLAYQLLLIPLCVLFFKKYHDLYQFYFLALMTWFIGSFFYYFFPTMGPASVIDSPYFIDAQRYTGLKFWQLHHFIQPVTAEGGMIAMPSFHVIWAWLCVLLVRSWPIVFALLGCINLILVFSCVFLGWHYFLDVVGSVLTLLLSHFVYHVCHRNTGGRSVLAC